MNNVNIINHDQLGNTYMELHPLPSEEMIWSNSHDHHDHMVFPNDILNTSHNSSAGGIELEPEPEPKPEPEPEPELAVQDPSHDHSANNENDATCPILDIFS
uniref:Uncharacterized protein n=1 Tax=Solanum tuberosum TaxID=4113 RepID=M1BX43_SOLTU